MLLIVIEDKQGPRSVRTRIGDPDVIRKFNGFVTRDVQEVLASDEELDSCFKILSRTPNGDTLHTFCGDSAREIVFNWMDC